MSAVQSTSALKTLKEQLYDINAIDSAGAIFDWDQQCFMPEGGGEARAEHSSRLARMSHELKTSDAMGRLIEEASIEAEPGSVDAALVRVVKREYDLSTKLPGELVARKSKLGSQAHEAWVKARRNNEFKTFAPVLGEMVEIIREEATHLGYKDHPYDALTDLYEEGATKASWDAMFGSIRKPLVELVDKIKNSGTQHDNKLLFGDWSQVQQSALTEKMVQVIGFDFHRGRQDTAPHPFCSGWSVGDIRLTTRYEDYLGSSIFGSLHEAGHGMYEQGSPMEWDRLPICGGVSLGVHESQSRLWENIVGRSKPFWQHFMPMLTEHFPVLSGTSVDTWHKAVNRVEPSYIRVEADEVTYSLHIMIRFEAECAFVTGELNVNDLPDYWNSKYEEYLGITPPTDSLGCLQDVHWSGGAMGYFPTYSMGSILSYQIWAALLKDVSNADELMAAGNFKPILRWLIDKIYQHGSRYTPTELITRATGEPMNASHYISGITSKYSALYNLS